MAKDSCSHAHQVFLKPSLVSVFILLICHLITTPYVSAAENGRTTLGSDIPAISILIDDLGYTYEQDVQAVQIRGALSYAFLPHTPHAKELAELAYELHKDVLLHLPMQSTEPMELGPGGLTMDMNAKQLRQIFHNSLEAIPHAIGINNHMGSLLTQHPGHMQWLMQAINEQGNLFFVDSFTAPKSIAQQIAKEHWVPSIKRDVFLDTDRSHGAIEQQFHRLLNIARKNGIALGIAHPYPETLTVLENFLPKLSKKGVRLVPVSQLIKLHMRRLKTWRAYLSL